IATAPIKQGLLDINTIVDGLDGYGNKVSMVGRGAALLDFMLLGAAGKEGKVRGIKGETPKFERIMSEQELKATRENNLLRGGREGENFFSKEGSISLDAKRAQQRLGLDGRVRTHKMEFEIIDPNVKITGPRVAKPGKSGTSGGGNEYSTNQTTRIKIIKVRKLKNKGYDY